MLHQLFRLPLVHVYALKGEARRVCCVVVRALFLCRFPVFFLSGCGIYPHADSKRTSSEAAIQFASNNKIPGEELSVLGP